MSELPFDPKDLGAMLQRIGAMLSSDETGPVSWDTVRETAHEALAAGGSDTSSQAHDPDLYADAMRLAQTWLDDATVLPASVADAELWTRAQWIDATLPHWAPLVEPLASRATDALTSSMPDQLGAVAPEMSALMAGPMGQMAKRMGAAMFGMQLGQGMSQLAGTVLSTGDLAVPLGQALALVPDNITTFGDGLGVPDHDVRLHVALRAGAHHRLVTHAPWLPSRFAAAVNDYARGISVDMSGIEEMMRSIDPSDPSALQGAIESGMFAPPESPEQKAAQLRVATLIALVEGWVDDVVAQAGSPMPSGARLREATGRRRATGGPAEQTFEALIGLELRPRRLRDAAALWERLREERGIEGRDALWGHPDLLPTDADFDAPDLFLAVGDIDWSQLDATTQSTSDDATGSSPDAVSGDSDTDDGTS